MAWKTWPRCTARPAAIQPLMAVDTDAARSSRCAREPSSCSEPSADSAGAGGGARGSLPELVKKVAAAEWIGSRRHRSTARSCSNMAGATGRTPGAHDAPGPGPPRLPTLRQSRCGGTSGRTAQNLRCRMEAPRRAAPPPRPAPRV
jgi:hypothetical protein